MSTCSSLSIYPYEPFEMEPGLNIINFRESNEYSKLLFFLYQLKNKVRFEDDSDNPIHFFVNKKRESGNMKNLELIGSLPNYSVNTPANLKLVFKKITEYAQNEFRSEIEQTNTNINDLVFDSLSRFNGIFDYELLANFESLLKFKLVRFDNGNWQNYYDKILCIINFYTEFSEKKLLIFHDFYTLLNLDQLNEIHDYLKAADIILISFESNHFPQQLENRSWVTFDVDADHVRFDY